MAQIAITIDAISIFFYDSFTHFKQLDWINDGHDVIIKYAEYFAFRALQNLFECHKSNNHAIFNMRTCLLMFDSK